MFWNPYFIVFFLQKLFFFCKKKQTWPNYWLKTPKLGQIIDSTAYIYIYVHIYIYISLLRSHNLSFTQMLSLSQYLSFLSHCVSLSLTRIYTHTQTDIHTFSLIHCDFLSLSPILSFSPILFVSFFLSRFLSFSVIVSVILSLFLSEGSGPILRNIAILSLRYPYRAILLRTEVGVRWQGPGTELQRKIRKPPQTAIRRRWCLTCDFTGGLD